MLNPSMFAMPFIGGFIGLFTNYLAVIMLFRPYKDKKIGGLKLIPKGVIPKNQFRLAEKIGETVHNDLLNAEDIIAKIDSEKVQGMLRNTIHATLENRLNSEIPSISEMLPPELQENFSVMLLHLSEKVVDSVLENLSSENHRQILSETISFLEKIIADDFKSDNSVIKKYVGETANNVLSSDFLISFTEGIIDYLDSSDYTLEILLNDRAVEILKTELTGFLRKLSSGMGSIFENQHLCESIADKISVSLTEMPELSMMSAFLSPDFIKSVILKVIQSNGESWVGYIADNIPENVLEHQSEKILSDLSKVKLADIAKFMKKADIASELGNKLYQLTLYNRENIQNYLFSVAEESFQKADFHQLAGNLKTFCKSDKLKLEAKKFTVKILLRLTKVKIGTPGKLVPRNLKLYIEEKSLLTLNKTLKEKLPEIIKTVNFREIVQTKVSSFSLQKLEEIVRNVAKKELHYITVFGGIIGFMIGCIQLLWLFFTQ